MSNRSSEYMAWQNMKQRCYNLKFRQYADYGGRGITVFPAWLERGGFLSFLAEVGPKPSPAHTLDRKDNNRNYEPGNIRWATRIEQNRNTSKNVFLTVEGNTKTLSEWSALTGLKHSTLRCRIAMGWEPDRIINTPARPIKKKEPWKKETSKT